MFLYARSPVMLWSLLYLLAALCGVNAATATNLTRTICYSGSLIYQQITQVCQEQDSSYTGDWYCSKTEVCESFISPARQCMSTKGCAKESQCYTTGTTSGTLYDNYVVTNSGGALPAGMTVRVSCCMNAKKFPTDDATISWAPGVICNSASRRTGVTAWVWAITGALMLSLSLKQI